MARDGHTTQLAAIYSAAGLISGGVAAVGFVQDIQAAAIAGVVGLVLVAVVAPISFVLDARASNPNALGDVMIHELRELRKAIDQLSQHAALSDDARRVLHRTRERELLRNAIEQDITSQDWDAALVLCTELAQRFGYREDAEGFRTRIDAARADTLDRRLTAAIASLDAMIVERRWGEAIAEAARLRRLFPDEARTEPLAERVASARQAYKADLEGRFLNAAREERVDDAMTMLAELDQYLTETEAEPYREVARGVPFYSEGLEEKLARRKSRNSLSPRELDVLTLLVKGHSNKEIESVLHLSQSTVKHHLANVFAKLGVHDRTQAATAAVYLEIVSLE